MEHCTEREENGCLSTEWSYVYWFFTLVITWVTGSCGLPPLPSVTSVLYHVLLAWEKIKIQSTVSALYVSLSQNQKAKKSKVEPA